MAIKVGKFPVPIFSYAISTAKFQAQIFKEEKPKGKVVEES